jgi:hypothetical protein
MQRRASKEVYSPDVSARAKMTANARDYNNMRRWLRCVTAPLLRLQSLHDASKVDHPEQQV